MKFKIFGRMIVLSRGDWEKIKGRFSHENAEYNRKKKLYEIQISCPLCLKHSGLTCSRCPFDVFRDRKRHKWEEGCVSILGMLGYQASEVFIRPDMIYWEEEEDAAARRWLMGVRHLMVNLETPEKLGARTAK